jgi:hypothetical protein
MELGSPCEGEKEWKTRELATRAPGLVRAEWVGKEGEKENKVAKTVLEKGTRWGSRPAGGKAT